MDSSARSVLVLAAALVLVSCQPADAWYKPAAGPSYYSVGRASGLLSGIRRSPHTRRAESDTGSPGETETGTGTGEPESNTLSQRLPPALRNMVVCVKEISPNLQSCELDLDGSSTFRCKADVLLALDTLECAGV